MPHNAVIEPASPAPIMQASALSRQLSADKAVCDLSLSVYRGDIVGLLGLNGAGKTTTLRMLAGVLAPESGTVAVHGFSMADQPLKARALTGFLPDQPPLYDDMRVDEYLAFSGRIRGVRREVLARRVSTVTEQCELNATSHQLISTLSKGYRQRLGLAQAIIHQPALLLLDEPSNGLDPQQLVSMRTLIQQLSSDCGIILSTHLLTEAQQTCNRVAIIHDGQLVADQPADGDSLEQLFHEAIS